MTHEIQVAGALRKWRAWTTGSVDELAAAATAFIWALGLDPQPGTTAAGEVTRRTIRYYVSAGLLDPPEGQTRTVIYDYRHLIQLLAIKAGQHAGERLDEIRPTLRNADLTTIENELLGLLPEHVSPPLPDDPHAFRDHGTRPATLARWAYLTGRTGRWPTRGTVRSQRESSTGAMEPVTTALTISEGSDGREPGSSPETPRHRVHYPLGDEIELVVPADHPLVVDDDGRDAVLRAMRRLLRGFLHDSDDGSSKGENDV